MSKSQHMKKLLDEIVLPMLQFNEKQQNEILLNDIEIEVRMMLKNQVSNVNKQLAKRSRELFIISSQNQAYKEKIIQLESYNKQFQNDLKQGRNLLSKLKFEKQKQKDQLQFVIQTAQNKIKQLIFEHKNELQKKEITNLQKIRLLNKEFKKQISKVIEKQRAEAQKTLQKCKQDYEKQKIQILAIANSEKSALIKKHQNKLYSLRENNRQELNKIVSEGKNKESNSKKTISELKSKLMEEESQNKKLAGQLNLQSNLHKKYKQMYQQIKNVSENLQKTLDTQNHRIKILLQQTQRNLIREKKQHENQVNNLTQQLSKTINEKDTKFNNTVTQMQIQHKIQIDSLTNVLLEEKQMAINQHEINLEEQMFKCSLKYQQLEDKFQQLKKIYQEKTQYYQNKLNSINQDNQRLIQSINTRKQYELELESRNAQKQYSNMLIKYTLQINSLHKKYESQIEVLVKKSQDEKISQNNKLTSQYETIINEQKNNYEIQMKQKIIEFERKSKNYEKKLIQNEKRRTELKIIIDKIKIDTQIKIQSMIDISDKLQQQIDTLQDKIIQIQNSKQVLIGDYQFKLILCVNQLEQVQNDYIVKQEQLRNILNQHIIIKNQQIAKFDKQVQQSIQELIKTHHQRIDNMQRQYNELKKIIGQKSSLPQDIEALKIFHAAFIQKEIEVEKIKKQNQQLQRQLCSQNKIDKIFTDKTFKLTTVKKNNLLANFASQQL